MKPQDLRIGNLLVDSLTSSLIKVSGTSEIGFRSTVIDRSKFPLPDGWKAIPIQLTEEWLLKSGFKKEYSYFIFPDFPVLGELCTSTDGDYVFDTENDVVRIHYVHQLQNLYHSLTGNELTIIL